MDIRTALVAALGADSVIAPEDAGRVLATVDYRGVRDRTPAAVVRPRSFAAVGRALEVLHEHGEPVSVIGGGHGPRNVVTGVVCLDLRSIPREATQHGDEVRVNGSALVQDLLHAVPDGRRVVPVGVAPTPGVGLLTTAGVGGLTRSLGLSIDSIRSLELLLADGRTLTVSAESPTDLWWAVRGAATRLGVVAAVTFATHEVPHVHQTHVLTRASVLATWAEVAPAMPPTTTLSWTMSPAADGGPPLLLLDEVSTGPDPTAFAAQVLGRATALQQRSWQHLYRDMATFAVPECGLHRPPAIPDPRMRRTAAFLSARGLAAVVEDVSEHLRGAPTPWCRVETQHMGGACAAVAEDETAFWGRAAEYSLVGTAMWPAGSAVAGRAIDWVRDLEALVVPATVARYVSEAQPGLPDLGRYMAQSYGPHLPRLQEVAAAYDPHGRFRYAPPFTPDLLAAPATLP